MKKPTFRDVLQAFSSFLLFFVSAGFVVSCRLPKNMIILFY